MSTYLATPIVSAPSSSKASTVTVTKVHQLQAKVIATVGVGPGASTSIPNVIIASKRARVNSKDKDVKKVVSEIAPIGAIIVKKEICLDPDLRNMMHAFGDSCNPLEESVRVLETILKQELQGFVLVCESIAAFCESKVLGLLEPIYAIKNERQRLIRLLKYFATKDQQMKLQRMNSIPQSVVPAGKPYLEEIRAILDKFDESGEYTRLLEPEYMLEVSKTEKALRADKISQRINYPKYLTYAKARSVSFARKTGNLQEWIQANTRSEYKMSPTFVEVMSFLAYEIVSQMVDLAFLVRREHIFTTNPIIKLMASESALNPETCMSAPAFQKQKDDPANNVSEILVGIGIEKVTTPPKEIPLPKSLFALTVNEITEAYNRFQTAAPPAVSYKVRAENLRRINYHYQY